MDKGNHVSFLNFFSTIVYLQCPTLVSDFSQDTCISRGEDNEDSFYFDLDQNSCIPKCMKYKDAIYKNCSSDKTCMPGYVCEKRCGPDDDSKINPCEQDSDCPPKSGDKDNSTVCDFYCMGENKESCMAYHINTRDYNKTYWSAQKFKPACYNDGSWKAKQCKGGVNGRCLCFDSQGKRLFGEALYKDAENMTCACSRQQADTENKRSTSFHCDSMGNYEPLQCDIVSQQCWCVEPKTGDLASAMVPEKAINVLPCYSEKDYGTQYLRQCESKYFAQERIKYKLNIHGATYVKQDFILCNADGSYGSFTIENNNAYCTWRDNTKIGSYQANIQSGFSDLNCNCARDYYRYGPNQICQSNGNYKPLQNNLTNLYCLDQDGFAKTNLFIDVNATEDSYCSQFY